MRNLYLITLGLFVLCTFTAVNAQDSCDLKSFNVNYKFPSDVSNYGLAITNNLVGHNIELVAGTSWQFFADSSLRVPSIKISVDQQTRTIRMVVDEANDRIKTAGTSSLVPSASVLLAGLALVFGSNKKYVFLGLFLCFAASVMAFSACRTIMIIYPSEVTLGECAGCEQRERETRDAVSQCPASGIVCAVGNCCGSYYDCYNNYVHTELTRPMAAGTNCLNNQVVLSASCGPCAPFSGGAGQATAAPVAPTQAPTKAPTQPPYVAPTQAPTQAPTKAPTQPPYVAPTQAPTKAPTAAPVAPTQAPTQAPTKAATQAPATQAPTAAPTKAPTQAPYVAPTQAPTQQPITITTPTTPQTCTNHLMSGPGNYYTDAYFCTTTHLPYTLSLASDSATLEQQVAQIMALPSYNDPTVYQPTTATSATYQASFYPPQRLYNNNPTQTLIGLTNVLTNLNEISTKLRLPSMYFGMFLAYAMDHWGIDPHFLLAQAGKEAAATMVDPSFTQNFFTCPNSNIASGGCSGQVYDCRATYNVGDPAIQGVTHQGCPAVDNFGIALGPFQIETEGFAEVASVAPQRFWIETPTHTAANTIPKSPLYLDSGSIALTSTNVKAVQANFTSHNSDSLAIIGAGIYHHWVHNVLMLFPLKGFRSAFDIRNSAQQAELAFATILYLYNRGVNSALDFSNCQPTDDPTSSTNCPTSGGFGGYAQQIKAATFSLEQATGVYDYPIQWNDVLFFINQMQLSYPYQCVNCDLGGSYGYIDWAGMQAEAYKIYQKLAANRANHYTSDVQTGISFRYDWRLMMAVIRAYLPGRDMVAGPDFAPWNVRNGASLASDPGPYASAPFNGPSWVAPAGQRSTQMASCPGATCATSAPAAPTSAPAPTLPVNTNTCPISDGTVCTANCASTFYQCSGGTAYPLQNVPVGTKCYQGAFILAGDSRCAGQ